jgi:hypothetical protein
MKKLILFAFVTMLGFVALQSFTLVEQPAEAKSMIAAQQFDESHFLNWAQSEGYVIPGNGYRLCYDLAGMHMTQFPEVHPDALGRYCYEFGVNHSDVPYKTCIEVVGFQYLRLYSIDYLLL